MSSINRPLAGPMLSFDIAEQLDILRREEAFRQSGRAGRTLVHAGRLRVTLLVLAADHVIGTHQADSPMTLQLLSGGLRFRTDGGDHELRAGQLLFFGPGDANDIRATEDSALLLTLSAVGDDFKQD